MTIVTVVPGIEGEIDRSSGCINWQGSKLKNGYGRKWIDGKTVLVHRLVLASKIAGFLDSGHFACHTCDNQSCINPAHLVAGTAAENTEQMMGRERKTPRRKSIPGIGKLSIAQLREIQTKYLAGTIKNHLAKEYGVDHDTITKILKANIPQNFTTVSPNFLGEIQDNGCIIFQGAKDGQGGYGRYFKNGKSKSVSRAVLAEQYSVGRKTIHCIKYHLTWKAECEEVPAPRMGGSLDRKLTFAQALEIRERIQAGESLSKIAQEFGVSSSVIYDIKNNVTYRGE